MRSLGSTVLCGLLLSPAARLEAQTGLSGAAIHGAARNEAGQPLAGTAVYLDEARADRGGRYVKGYPPRQVQLAARVSF